MQIEANLRNKASQGTESHINGQWTESETDGYKSLQRFESTEKTEKKNVHINSETDKNQKNRELRQVASA